MNGRPERFPTLLTHPDLVSKPARGGRSCSERSVDRRSLCASMPERISRANARRSAVRSAVEHVFAVQKHRTGPFIRTIGIARARIKIGMANLAYNFQRLAWLEGPGARA